MHVDDLVVVLREVSSRALAVQKAFDQLLQVSQQMLNAKADHRASLQSSLKALGDAQAGFPPTFWPPEISKLATVLDSDGVLGAEGMSRFETEWSQADGFPQARQQVVAGWRDKSARLTKNSTDMLRSLGAVYESPEPPADGRSHLLLHLPAAGVGSIQALHDAIGRWTRIFESLNRVAGKNETDAIVAQFREGSLGMVFDLPPEVYEVAVDVVRAVLLVLAGRIVFQRRDGAAVERDLAAADRDRAEARRATAEATKLEEENVSEARRKAVEERELQLARLEKARVEHELREAVDRMARAIPESVTDKMGTEPAQFLERAVSGVYEEIVLGARIGVPTSSLLEAEEHADEIQTLQELVVEQRSLDVHLPNRRRLPDASSSGPNESRKTGGESVEDDEAPVLATESISDGDA